MLKFKTSPITNKPYMGTNTDWIVSIYKKYFDGLKNGFLVEIGVGHTLDWSIMGKPRLLNWQSDVITRGESHTIELLENGWTGIYIESIWEFIDNELSPLLKTLLPKEQFEKIKMVKLAASDEKKILQIVQNETLSFIKDEELKPENDTPYQYKNRKIICNKTSSILNENSCIKEIDLMLIDVEGHEINVLKGLDFSLHSPKLLLIEISSTPLNQIEEYLLGKYHLLQSDGLNAMFARTDFYKK